MFNGVVFPQQADVSFVGVCFKGPAGFFEFCARANFDRATFEDDVEFRSPDFGKRVVVTKATFKKSLTLTYDHNQRRRPAEVLSFWDCSFEQPERVVFSSTILRPEWFVCVDPTKFQFRGVEWERLDLSRAIAYVGSSLDRSGAPVHDILSAAYRSLATNAEGAQRYDEASTFRYAAQDTLRLARWRGRAFWQVRWWYWLASGYGERVSHGIAILLTLWIVFAYLYSGAFASLSPTLGHLIVFTGLQPSPSDAKTVAPTDAKTVSPTGAKTSARTDAKPVARTDPKTVAQTGEKVADSTDAKHAVTTNAINIPPTDQYPAGEPLPLSRALTYSLEVMALQKPTPPPASPAAHALVTLQVVLGPLEAALLALAVRRKVASR